MENEEIKDEGFFPNLEETTRITKRGLGARPILESQIKAAQAKSKSAREAARTLGISYNTYKKYAKLYGIFEDLKNPYGYGINRQVKIRNNKYNIEDLINGKHLHYPIHKFKNKLFDSGVSKLVKVLGRYKHLKRLFLGSNGLTEACIDDITDAFISHPNLIVLDLGMYKSTSDMGMITNNIGDQGAIKLCKLIESNKKMVYLNVMMNGLTEKGLECLAESVKQNNSLLYFEYKQYGTHTPQTVNKIIRTKFLNEPRILFGYNQYKNIYSYICYNNSRFSMDYIINPIIFKKLDDDNNNIPDGAAIATTTTDANGHILYVAEEIPNMTLFASKNDYLDLEKPHAFNPKSEEEFVTLVMEKNPGYSLIATVKNVKDQNPLSEVKIKILAKKPQMLDSAITSTDGKYQKALPKMKPGDSLNLFIKLEKNGYLTKESTVRIKLKSPGVINLNEYLNTDLGKIEVGLDIAKMIDIKPIYFDLGKYAIRKDAKIELDKIVKVMNDYPKMVIELGSHTDCRSSATSNLSLSDKRAKASADYIKQLISNPERINGKGYGESKLKNACACEGAVKSTCSEIEHQENRRTEFIILKSE